MNISVIHPRKCLSRVRNELFIITQTGKSLSKKRKTSPSPHTTPLLPLGKWNGHPRKNFTDLPYTYSASSIRIFYFAVYHENNMTHPKNSDTLKANSYCI